MDEVAQLGGATRPWLVRYGGRTAILRASGLDHLFRMGFSVDLARRSLAWLHDFLSDLTDTGFVAPAPIDDLGGQSIATTADAVWELLSFVPGRPMGWLDDELRESGALLARFHDATQRMPLRSQRPGALPIANCRPADASARSVRALVDAELSAIGHDLAPRGVVHGDATQANVVIDGDAYHLVDYALTYQEPVLFDIASALWRNGRRDATAVTYDASRVACFVRGYHEVRRLEPTAARAIVAYLMGRGLQLQARLELRGGTDATVMQRLLAVERQRHELHEAIVSMLS